MNKMRDSFFKLPQIFGNSTEKAFWVLSFEWHVEWEGRPARLFCFIRHGRDARATLCFDRFSSAAKSDS